MSDLGDLEWDDTREIPRIEVDPDPTTSVQQPQEEPQMTVDSQRAEELGAASSTVQQVRAAAVRSAMEVLRGTPFESADLSEVLRLATWLLYGVDTLDHHPGA